MINRLNEHLLDKPSLKSDTCCVCGAPASNDHHVIPKGMGGSKLAKRIPTVSLCGMGNTSGCHGKAHSGRLFFDYRDGAWVYHESSEPMTMFDAHELSGWEKCLGGCGED